MFSAGAEILIRFLGIVPAEVFDTRTRAKGVSIGVMVSFAFNTLIGQVTPIAMESVGWRYYILFVSRSTALKFCSTRNH